MNYLALAGYDADKAVETLPKVLNLAAAGGIELATTSDLVTDAISPSILMAMLVEKTAVFSAPRAVRNVMEYQ